MGDLVPIMVQECVPGDHFTIGCESLLRFQPLIAPVMHRFDVTMHYFFVPNRLVWENFGKWLTGDIEVVPPTMVLNSTSTAAGTLADYMGVPIIPSPDQHVVNAIPFAAYQMIYNEYYRDENLIPEVSFKLTEGDNPDQEFTPIRKRAWEKDYFTSALPWAQKGAAVDIPIGTLGDVPVAANTDPGVHSWTTDQVPAGSLNVNGATPQDPTDPITGGELFAQTSQLAIGSTTINDLRTAYRVQEWLEKNARGGTRYTESIYAHFGVKSSDARLNRPEYITGIKSPVIISEVLNTTGEDGGLPQGNMAGHGIGVTSGKYGKYFCEEHGYIIGIMSVLPLPAYQQGLPRHYGQRSSRYDYFWPEFAHLGEQEIKMKELYIAAANPETTLGYSPKYAEYKFQPSTVHGDLKTSLDFWHAGRIFDTEPALNQQFIEMVDDKRIFAVTDPNEDSLIAHVLNKVSAIRPMPFFGTPMT